MHGGAGWKHRGGIYRGHNIKLHVNAGFTVTLLQWTSAIVSC